MLPNTGNVGPMTWASLLVSCGDKNRKGTACDCSSEVTDTRAKTLKANGYEIVGRYIAGGEWKKLKLHEAQVIFKNGLRLFPIYQTAVIQQNTLHHQKELLMVEQGLKLR